ncbi:cytochrome c oxidase assembly factor 3, mitochondrial-like [Megalopta genalis]|uniref:cytochrome c oxidase assembly factor 3, mitochondrial-like n=1 Tax=Megalopta genalis TaxID=115081 RepID=UPI003FD03311
MSADNDSDVMPKVDFKKLKPVDLMHLKQAEQINLARASRHRELRWKTSLLGISLALGVIGIYVYTIKSVKQETFLDDFNEPETVIETPVQKQ